MIRANLDKRSRSSRERGKASKQTRPSLIAGLRRGDRKLAMPALFKDYRMSLLAFLRGLGCGRDNAEDVTQAFFAAMLKPGFFDSFDPERGRFRNWLRGALRRFYWNWNAKARREQAADLARVVEPIDDDDATSAMARAFDRAFTEVVMGRALERLRRWYADEGKQELFSELHLATLGERRAANDAAMSKVVGKSISLLKKWRYEEKQTWMLRYRGCLREEIAAFGLRRGSIDGVIAELLDASR
jgi:RNA polymerase sigma-70 factor (ECF subfamily)